MSLNPTSKGEKSPSASESVAWTTSPFTLPVTVRSDALANRTVRLVGAMRRLDGLADLERGLPRLSAIGLGGEQAGQLPEVSLGALAERLVDAVGRIGLYGGRGDPRHGRAP